MRFDINKSIKYDMKAEDVENILNDLTPDERKVADTMAEYYRIQARFINEVSNRLLGYDIADVENYFPIDIYSGDLKDKQDYVGRGWLETKKEDRINSFMTAMLENQGALKERVKSDLPLVLVDAFKATYKSIYQISTFYGLAEPLRTAKALLYNGEFRDSVGQRYDNAWEQLEEHVSSMETEIHRTDDLDRLVSKLIGKLDIANLGANAWVSMTQLISYSAASVVISPKYLTAAMGKIPPSAKFMGKWVPQLRERFQGRVTQETGEVSGVGSLRNFWTHKRTIGQKLMSTITRFDRMVIGRLWRAAEMEIRDNNPTLKGNEFHKKVGDRVMEIVRLTQPTFHLKDRSMIAHRKDFATRLLTKYTTQLNKYEIMLTRAGVEFV